MSGRKTDEDRKSLKYNRLSEEQIKRIRKLRKEGLTQNALAIRFGVSQPTIVNALTESEGKDNDFE